MKEEVKTKRNVKNVESFREDGVFYSFKYEHVELIGDGKKYFELKTPITVMVETKDKKRLYFNFKADLISDHTYGKLSVVARDEKSTKYGTVKQTEDERVKVNFSSLTESAEFTVVLNRVHTECVRIVSSKFKDAITENDATAFFS